MQRIILKRNPTRIYKLNSKIRRNRLIIKKTEWKTFFTTSNNPTRFPIFIRMFRIRGRNRTIHKTALIRND